LTFFSEGRKQRNIEEPQLYNYSGEIAETIQIARTCITDNRGI